MVRYSVPIGLSFPFAGGVSMKAFFILAMVGHVVTND